MSIHYDKNLEIFKRQANLFRFIEIVNSMRKPQIKYEITKSVSLGYTSVRFLAMNELGSVLYICNHRYDNHLTPNKAFKDIESLPSKVFRKYFEAYNGVHDFKYGN